MVNIDWTLADGKFSGLVNLNQSLNKVINSEVVRTSLMKDGITPAPGTAAQANTLIELEWSRWGKIAKDAKINLD